MNNYVTHFVIPVDTASWGKECLRSHSLTGLLPLIATFAQLGCSLFMPHKST